jgi:hypothetical protein
MHWIVKKFITIFIILIGLTFCEFVSSNTLASNSIEQIPVVKQCNKDTVVTISCKYIEIQMLREKLANLYLQKTHQIKRIINKKSDKSNENKTG